MIKISIYINLLRLNRPIGIWLLLWPCFCGLALANSTLKDYLLFFIGTIALRSAGCAINDITDIKFDKHVKRSKNRPLAVGIISKIDALWLIFICLSIGFFVWLQLSFNAKILSLIAAVMMVIYPFLKRITYWPQIFLGFTFNIGFLITLLHKGLTLNTNHFFIYTGLICWTIFYDTIYAFADITDDLKIGVKSSAIKMQKHPKVYLSIINVISAWFLILGLNSVLTTIIVITGFIYLQYLLKLWIPTQDSLSIEIFKKSHYFGLGLWLGLEFIRVIAP